MASLTKSCDKIMNSQFDKPGAESVMENCISNGQRQSPMFPDLFDKALKTKRFTNRKKDLRLLMRLYRDIFLEEFSQAEVLHYPGLHWDDSHLVPVFDIIRLGFTPKLQELDIGYNSLGLEGCSALARAILSAPELRTLVLDYNKINDDFFEFDNQKLCKAIAKLQVVSLNGNRISNKAVSCLVAAMMVHNNPPNLVEIRLRMTNVDDKDLLTKVIECCPSLRQLDLFGTSLENEIRCPGAVQEN
ncbi:Leucine-rich repeat protein [Seminavis robusta]|uniref:Leucine-rich repeat protein n=1 Tax=Seminavis robusta TaxID=568900 RepID=A0A9N8E5J1_9STRA|nr:Leucine-rich repeat protein [Seminavis robusta]|eukprot:Sro570_g168590.1 Leucine-rich repeat protein (245) ;mRNA; r:52005-52739